MPQQPIRVMNLISRLNVGGAARHVIWLMAGLDKTRFEQMLVTGKLPPGEDDLSPWARAQQVDYVYIPQFTRSLHPGRDLIAFLKILSLMLKFKPDIIHTNAAKAGFLGRGAGLLYSFMALLLGRRRPRMIHTFHGHVFHSYFDAKTGRLFLLLEQVLAKLATWRILVLSGRQLKEINEDFKVGRREQFLILPLGLDLTAFRPSPEAGQRFRMELGLKSHELLVGAVGRIAEVKNYSLFIQTAAELKKLDPAVYQRSKFMILGGGSAQDMAALEAQAAALGVKGHITLLGSRQDPRDFYAALNCLLLTSLNEGTPLSILEAGMAGQAVTATAVGGVPDLLGKEIKKDLFTVRQRGFSAASGDARALALALKEILSNPSLAQSLGQNLLEYVTRQHSLERLCRDMAALYESSLNKSKTTFIA